MKNDEANKSSFELSVLSVKHKLSHSFQNPRLIYNLNMQFKGPWIANKNTAIHFVFDVRLVFGSIIKFVHIEIISL